jgi:hypothetical protein
MGKTKNKGQGFNKSKLPSFLRADKPIAKADKPTKKPKTDDAEIDMKSKVVITDEMFEAARLTKGGVAHIKDLDMSVLDTAKPKVIIAYQVTKYKGGATQSDKVDASVPAFDFESEAKFSPDEDC